MSLSSRSACAIGTLVRDRRFAIFDGVFDEIGERLADQFAIAPRARCRGLDGQREVAVFSKRFIELVDALGHFSSVEIVHIAARLP